MLKSVKKEEQLIRAVIHVVLISGAITMLAPFLWMILTAFKTKIESLDSTVILPSKLIWSNFSTAWYKAPFMQYFINTLFVAIMCTICQVMTSSLAAYAFSHMNFYGKDWLFAILMGTMMIPQQVLLVPDYFILKQLGWLNSYLALIVPWSAGFFGIFLLRQFFMTLPKDLWDAARIDGCSRLKFFFKILLPLSTAPLTTIAIFTFVGNWNSFLWPLFVTNDQAFYTIQVGLSNFNQSEGTEWHLLMAASTFCTLPLLIMFFIAQKQFIQGIAHTGSKE
ncbi:MAG TPA: carbohydrate ABC transporter permease [Candidatus Wallbacteria bacterium]|nr:carbohydrate ABC transporter permease [Candidatus Wallbacteria bacterium]